MKVHSTEEDGFFECKSCRLEFSNMSALKEHMQSHVKVKYVYRLPSPFFHVYICEITLVAIAQQVEVFVYYFLYFVDIQLTGSQRNEVTSYTIHTNVTFAQRGLRSPACCVGT